LTHTNLTGMTSSRSVGAISVAFSIGILGSFIQRLAPSFVFSLLPYHSVSC
ncbi:hypothetical protein SAMD00019534_098460, partial [Acytostelium subglobosum LB1]|uniref:hypothetical protein n=1 Tax=Acytostelium subglobosum LB1 TaxID=1410327 RepID=UPI000644A834